MRIFRTCPRPNAINVVKQTCLLLWFLACCLPAAFAQQDYSIYESITTSHGLPSNYVFAAAEDEQGFLWVGTDKGLGRYDGFRWRVWDKDNALPGNYVNRVLPDGRGGLWLVISEKGYFHFSPSLNRLEPLHLPAGPVNQSLQLDGEGNLYVEVNHLQSCRGLLFRPGKLQQPQIVFSYTGGQPVLLRGDAGRQILYCAAASEAALHLAKSAVATHWAVRTVRVPHEAMDQPLYYLNDSLLLTNQDYYRFSPGKKNAEKLRLFPAPNSYAFACKTADGLFVYNTKTGYYYFNRQHEETFYDRRSGLGTDYVSHIFQTRNGRILISTLGEGLQVIKNAYRRTFSTNNNTVKSLLADGNGWLLLAGSQAMALEKGENRLHLLGEVGTASLRLFQFHDTILVSSLRGVQFYGRQKNNWRPLNFIECNAGISSVIQKKDGYYAGTFGAGLLQFNSCRPLRQQSNYPFRIVEKLVSLPTGFAALSYEDGVLLTTGSTGQHRHLSKAAGLLSNSVYSLYQRADTTWIGTKGGLNLYVAGKIAQTLLLPAGAANDRVLLSFHDAGGKFWLVTNKGLYRTEGQRLLPLQSHPLIGTDDVISAAAYNAATDELAVGSNKTFSLISLSAIQPDTATLRPQLTRITVDGREQAGADWRLSYGYAELKLALAPLAAIPLSEARLYYRLTGLSSEWLPLKDSLTLSFAGLRPGTYTLSAKTVNADGYESAVTKLTRFTVEKPFWQQGWFLAGFALAVAGMTFVLVKQVDRFRRRKKEAALRLQQSLQKERERIAKDLHDHLGTNLTTIIAQSDHIEARLSKGDWQKANATVQHLSAHTRDTMQVLRETIWAVQEKEHTLDEFILRIRTLLQRLFEPTGVRWQVNGPAGSAAVLSPAQTLHLFRIIQEASQNIVKHSGAGMASVVFAIHQQQLHLTIEDNGRGFSEPAPSSNGLFNIHERVRQLGGAIIVRSLPSVGIHIQVPL